MATHLKGVFVSCLLLLILMEEAKPVLAKGKKLSKTVKKLVERVEKVEGDLKDFGKCPACKKIEELNDKVNKLQEKVDSIPELADCGDPGVPVHGYKTGQNYWAGGMVAFTCDAGYHLEGAANVVCEENGNWNNDLPKCQRMCNELAAPENGYLIGSEFWEGKSVTYKCNDGYGLQGPTVRACNESGVWTGEEPTCEPKHALAAAGLEDSAILKIDASYLKVLGDFLIPVVQSNFHWKHCLQLSRDGWDNFNSNFHSNCDDKGPTLTIVRVGQYVFGGYTSATWKQEGSSCTEIYDSSAFLYSLNRPGWQPVKLEQIERRRNSIYPCSSRGIAFGGGRDIYIGEQSSYVHIGNQYELPPGVTSRNVASISLAGSSLFKPDEVEVFYETT